jgi:hypothetical protein
MSMTDQAVEISFGSIPEKLQELDQWVLWKTVSRDSKSTKVPYSVYGTAASTTDPATWASFDNVVSTYDPSQHSGIGFVFTASDQFCGIDLDGCRDPETGTVADWAIDEVIRFSSYTEISPSQTGLKIWITADSSLPKGRKQELRVPEIVAKTPAIEVYTQRRYFAVTGQVYKQYHHIEHRESELQAFLKDYWPASPAVNTPQHDWRSDDAVVERARKYVGRIRGAVSGSSGHNVTFSVACRLIKGFELTADQAFDVISEWNGTCDPPWSEHELRHKIESAGKASGESGYLRNAKPERYDSITVPDYKRSEAGKVPVMVRSFEGVPADELSHLADQPVEWLVTDVFSAEQPTIFGAKQKSMKTTLLTDLAVALASGLPWLGRYEVPKARRVLLITGEASQAAAIRKVIKAAGARNLRLKDFTANLRIEALTFPTLPSMADCAAVSRAVQKHEVDVVIVDPLYMGLQGLNTGNLCEVGPAMKGFMEACRPAKMIIAHHVKKTASFDDAPNLEDLSQAGIAEYAGNYWLMGRMTEYMGDGVHQLAIRFGGRDEQFGLLKMEFNEKDWTCHVTSLIDHREDLKARNENQRVVGFTDKISKELKRYPAGISEAKLAAALGTRAERSPFQAALELLETRGAITCLPDFKPERSKACKGWILTNDALTDDTRHQSPSSVS